MREWDVVLVIVALVGLFTSVTKPILSLNNTVTRLTSVVRTLEENIKGLTVKNSETHEKIWHKLKSHDDRLHQCETRLLMMENRQREP